MRKIDVDLDVFSAIWSMRGSKESSENQILRRLLAVDKNKDFELASRVPAKQKIKKIRWVDDVVSALKAANGQSDLSDIYRRVRFIRQDGGRSCPNTLEAVVRRTIEDHSSDSSNFRSDDLFKHIDRGVWALR